MPSTGGRLPFFLAAITAPIPLASPLCLQGHVCCFYAATYVKLCQRHAQVPRLTDEQEAAFAEFERLANSDECCMHYKLEVGDIQLLNNNHTVVSWASRILYLPAAQSSAVTSGCMQVKFKLPLTWWWAWPASVCCRSAGLRCLQHACMHR